MHSDERRQITIRGACDRCSHPDGAIEEILSYGGDCIGMRCRLCGDTFGKAFCVGCEGERWCVVVSADGMERWCSADCRAQTIAARTQGVKYRQGQGGMPGAPRKDRP